MAVERLGKIPLGGWLIIVAAVLFVIERVTSLSSGLGRLACGDAYLQPVGDTLTETACGFDFDLYLGAFIFVIAFLGIGLLAMRMLRSR